EALDHLLPGAEGGVRVDLDREPAVGALLDELLHLLGALLAGVRLGAGVAEHERVRAAALSAASGAVARAAVEGESGGAEGGHAGERLSACDHRRTLQWCGGGGVHRAGRPVRGSEALARRCAGQKTTPGSQVVSVGTKVSSIRTTSPAVRNGQMPLKPSNMSISAISAASIRFRPTGGVTSPRPMFTTITTPRWSGSMPSSIATGKRIGMRMMIAALASMNMPTKSSSTLISSRITIGLWDTSMRVPAIACGTPPEVSAQE